MTWSVAVGSGSGEMIDQHFGSCGRFLIYEISGDGTLQQTGVRCYEEKDGAALGHAESRLQAKAELLSGCAIVLVSQIGPGAKALLQEQGILAMAVQAPVEQALKRLISFIKSGQSSILQSH